MEKAVFVDEKIDHLKPNMKLVKDFREIPLSNSTVAQVKVDGEFNLLRFKNGCAYTINRWGRKRMDLPALREVEGALGELVKEAELLIELYAIDGKPLKLPQFLHYIKSGDPNLLTKVHIGVWDILSINGNTIKNNYLWKYDEASMWFSNCSMVRVLPYIKVEKHADIQRFWNKYVAELGYEGLVFRTNGEIYKMKPKGEIDAVIVAINKKNSYGKATLFKDGLVTSLHLAVMDDDGRFIEIGDCASGINNQLRTALWKLMEFKVSEDENKVWIKPFVVCTIEYTDIFESENTIYMHDGKSYIEQGKTKLIRLRHPRLIKFRADKKATPNDIGLNQIPYKFIMKGEKT